MSTPRQDPDSIRLIEEALVALRRDHAGGRMRHGAERGFGRGRGPHGFGDSHGESHENHGDAPGVEHGGGFGPGHRPGFGRGGHERGGLGGAAKFRLLEALRIAEAEGTRMGVSEVAQAIGVDQPRASRLVNESAERGLVTREPDPRDARRSIIEITAAGRQLIESAHNSRRAAVTDALAGFSEEETAQFAALFSRFAAAWPRT